MPHHLLDVIDRGRGVQRRRLRRLARGVCSRIERPILVGGTFFYLRALLTGLPRCRRATRRCARDASAGSPRLGRLRAIATAGCRKIDPRSGRKIAPATGIASRAALGSGSPAAARFRAGNATPRSVPAIRIACASRRAALTERLDAARRGDVRERPSLRRLRALLTRFPSTARPFGTIGYREAAAVVRGELTESEAIAETRRRTRAYATRQMTWLRSERNVHWIDVKQGTDAVAEAMRVIEDSA